MNLLCSDSELDYLKRLFAEIEETRRVAKQENDFRDWQREQPNTYKLTHLTLRECFRPWLRKDYDKEW